MRVEQWRPPRLQIHRSDRDTFLPQLARGAARDRAGHCPRRGGAGAGRSDHFGPDRAYRPGPGGAQRRRDDGDPCQRTGSRRRHQPGTGAAHHERVPALFRSEHEAGRNLRGVAQFRLRSERRARPCRSIRVGDRGHSQDIFAYSRGFQDHFQLPQGSRWRAGSRWPVDGESAARGLGGESLDRTHGHPGQAVHGLLPSGSFTGWGQETHCRAVHRQLHRGDGAHAAPAGRADAVLRAWRHLRHRPARQPRKCGVPGARKRGWETGARGFPRCPSFPRKAGTSTGRIRARGAQRLGRWRTGPVGIAPQACQ